MERSEGNGMKKPRLAIIDWTDAAVHGNEQCPPDDEGLEGQEMTSYGLVTTLTKEKVVLAMDDCHNGEYRTYETIPRALITKIRYPKV